MNCEPLWCGSADGTRNPNPRAGGEGGGLCKCENITNIPAGLHPVPYRITLDPTAKVCMQRGLGLGELLVAVPWVCGHQKSWWPPCGFLSPCLGMGVNEHIELLFPMPKLLLSGETNPQESPHYNRNYLFPLALDAPKLYLLLPKSSASIRPSWEYQSPFICNYCCCRLVIPSCHLFPKALLTLETPNFAFCT